MSEEIRIKINALNEQLEECMDPTTFVLNQEAAAIFKQIEALRKQCQHSFEGKECIYCGWRESE